MIIDLTNKEKKLLLEILGIALQVEFLKGNNNSRHKKLIQKAADSLKKEGNMDIFNSVFTEFKI